MSGRMKLVWTILFILVIASVISNIVLVTVALSLQQQINQAAGTAGLALDNAASQLATVETQEFTLVVPIDQQIPISATIAFDEEFLIPIDVTVPINTDVAVPLNLGFVGNFDLDIPIRTEVPIDITVPIRIQKEVPIETVVPVQLDVPVTLSLRGTPMADQLAEWRTILIQLREQLP